ncbi:hypothetical protein [Planctomicrobium sp. SH527]
MNHFSMSLETITRISLLLDVLLLMVMTSGVTALVCREIYKRE